MAVKLHRIACSRGSTPSCVEVAIEDASNDPGAIPRLQQFCISDRQLAACEFLASRDSANAARVGCELGSNEACRAFGRLWQLNQTQGEARLFFSRLCSDGRAEACVEAGDLSPSDDSAGAERLRSFDQACKLGNAAGCWRLMDAAITRITNAGPDDVCLRYAQSIATACAHTSQLCQLSLFCSAARGNQGARMQLQAACRDTDATQGCRLFLQLSTTSPGSTSKPPASRTGD